MWAIGAETVAELDESAEGVAMLLDRGTRLKRPRGHGKHCACDQCADVAETNGRQSSDPHQRLKGIDEPLPR